MDIRKTFVFDSIPASLEELKKLPGAGLNDPCAAAALCALAFNAYPKDRDACFEMLNYLKGPRPLTNFDISFIKDRFMDGVDYVPRSYFAGSSPDNGYTPSVPYAITVFEGVHSRDQIGEGYIKIFMKSSGADSDRYIVLRHKPSTDQWFVWQFEGLLVGIRPPESSDPWA
ncbi:MAG: hypothetical protein J5854_01735 [Clostridia bacterium]|nr:hypothetical protein [Clostridia bacterium]